MGIVISLLNEGELLALGLIQASLDRISLLQFLKSEHEQFCVMLVRQTSIKMSNSYMAWYAIY